MKIERIWAMPNRNTFEIPCIKKLIEEEKNGTLWIDPFANKNKIAEITNDLDESFDTHFHEDALCFLQRFQDESIDGVLFDPPYSPRQVSESYKKFNISVNMATTQSSYWSKLKKEIARIIKKDGKTISCAWNSCGIGKTLGFEINRILMVCHGGNHNDTIVTVETKIAC